MIDLNTMDLKQLKSLRSDLERAIASFEDRRRREALTALQEQAKNLGFSLEELVTGKMPKQRKSPATKYVHPENSSITWSGRGRKPIWFAEALAAGKKPEEMIV
jgi:DNA-binding protein H-NS